VLRRIEVNGYRGIRSGTVEGFDRVNLLVGKNGSGKSTLLESIFLGAHIGPAYMYGSRPLIERRHNESSFPSPDCFWGKSGHQAAHVLYRLEDSSILLNITMAPAQRVSFAPEKFSPDQKTFFSSMKLLDVHILFDKNLERLAWDNLLNVRGDRVLVATLNEVYDLQLESFSYSINSQSLKALFRGKDYALNIDDLGAGMRIAFRVFVSIVLSSNSAVLAEEIDAYQDVEGFSRFIKALVRLAEENNVQLFLSTHRLETLRTFVDVALEHSSLPLRIFQTRLTPDGLFETACLDAAKAKTLMEGGFDLRRID
jgi:hypothetical protein